MGRLVLTISSSTTPQLHHHHNPPPNWRRPKSNKNGIKEEKMMGQEGESSNGETNKLRRLPLSEVVGDCVRRWFRDTLNEARAGDINMQVLVGQMYYSGYGVPRDAQKGRIWMSRASRVRSSVWKVSNKRPGYNASDSDSDELIAGS
ncbi:uncharacterized protein LOC111403230 [Olea europaea var. sylvestris]|uniref:uncharacterized protein LOC111403230 n=1 Tax=Olea europaea var. sylvestris TaxID=158386 RepID=UPI000C1D522E|nr:uncharacterized protein LOC111403230 [Olea europaea var. sylvestris]